MRKLLLAILMGSFALNSYAAKPEWAGKDNEKGNKAELKAEKSQVKRKTVRMKNGITSLLQTLIPF